MRPSEFRDLPRYGIGLTDVCKHASGNDSDLVHVEITGTSLL